LPRVFERFYVVERSRSREHTGTGLGLAIAKHLVEAHGGKLVVESVYGSGAVFTMRIPGTGDH
jgi:two-component system phosphate regulon sensor histidine kinase PhoR